MADVKIAVIGAGSAVFSLNLIKDLALTPNLHGAALALMDINVERLNAVYSLLRLFAEEVNAKLVIEKTTDRREALRDADFVVNTALAASHDRLREGWSIASSLGYRFGGSLHVMHDEAFWVNFYQFKLFESIVEDVLEICPDAWYIQLSNPVLAGITYLGRKYPEAKIVGMCHGYRAIYHLAGILGLRGDEISFSAPGLNHFIWLVEFRYRGDNAFPILDAWIERSANEYWERCPPSDPAGPKPVDLYKRFGAFPLGDTCTPGGGSWPWWYHVNDSVEGRWKEDPRGWWEGYFSWLKSRVDELLEFAKNPSSPVSEKFGRDKPGEDVVQLIGSIACDVPRVFQVNVVNRGGLVPGIPENFEVEVPALVDGRGIHGIKASPLPKRVLAYALRDRVAPVEVELEAYESGDRGKLVELVMMDPWTRSQEQAEELVKKVLDLPYHAEMRRHYK